MLSTQAIHEAFADEPVKRAYVFGSFARGEEQPESDVDILIELSQPIGLYRLVAIQLKLENAFHRTVDLVTTTGLHSSIRYQVEKERKLIYER